MTTSQRWWERRFEQCIITNRNIPLHSKWKIQKQSVQHFLPACLQAFLVSNDLKRVGKGHTITQAVRPRSVIAPIVFGLGSELEQVFGSKWFLQLNSLCFSISYDEVYLFEHSVLHKESLLLITVNSAQTILIPTTINESSTFHGVGIIRWSRSKLNFQKTERQIRRRARIMISLIPTRILLIDFLIRTHSKECCIDQHGCYIELSNRHRIWRIGLVICRMFSIWQTTLHL